jgi:hypothetical protein
MGSMAALPEHHQPSSDARILKWVGALAALTVGAVLVRAGGRSRLAHH